MSDLRQQLQSTLDFDLPFEPAPIEALAHRNRQRRRRLWAATAVPVVASAIALIAVALPADHRPPTRVQLAGPSTSSQPTAVPVLQPGVVLATIPNLKDPTCSSAQPIDERFAPGPPLVTVDLAPTGLIAVWTPGSSDQPCHALATTGKGALAAQLAAAIDSQPGERIEFCPYDDGTNVTLYFTYRRQSQAEMVRKSLMGCGELSAPGVAARQGGDAGLVRLLRTIAPFPFGNYLPRTG